MPMMLQWGRRFSPTETPDQRYKCVPALRRFNGAVGFRLRRLYVTDERYFIGNGLQWGRRFSPTETRPSPAGHISQWGLQWGRRFSPTETPRNTKRSWRLLALQWGRRFSPTETILTARGAMPTSTLQWGRRFSPTETDGNRPGTRGDRVASMGP